MGADTGEEGIPFLILDSGSLAQDVRWLLGRDIERWESEDFLFPVELQEREHFRHPGRRRQWLLGRAAAKWLLLQKAGLPWSDENAKRYFILRHQDGWPQVLDSHGNELNLSLSLSHSGSFVLCALADDKNRPLGVDLEAVENRSEALVEDFFSAREKALLSSLPPSKRNLAINTIWCIKEAFLKAEKSGLRRPANVVEVLSLGDADRNGWYRAQVHFPGRPWQGFWRCFGDDLLVLAFCVG